MKISGSWLQAHQSEVALQHRYIKWIDWPQLSLTIQQSLLFPSAHNKMIIELRSAKRYAKLVFNPPHSYSDRSSKVWDGVPSWKYDVNYWCYQFIPAKFSYFCIQFSYSNSVISARFAVWKKKNGHRRHDYHTYESTEQCQQFLWSLYSQASLIRSRPTSELGM